MSRIYGEIRQLGYVVRDIEAAMRHWTGVLGVGPWYYVDRLPLTSFAYRGTPSNPHVSIALANSGGAQIELIQQRCETPSMYLDFLAQGPEGLQHVSTWPVDYDATLARALAAGHRIGQQGASNRGPFAYFETEGGHRGTCMEIAAYTGTRKRQFDAIEAAARDWDGRDPIRTTWPD
ncbi:MAG: VOC family protein [Proteobacteria bacterium]|nr:VOC family protein [Pseudomonadota bacterium]